LLQQLCQFGANGLRSHLLLHLTRLSYIPHTYNKSIEGTNGLDDEK
jgi:hypothetical protein